MDGVADLLPNAPTLVGFALATGAALAAAARVSWGWLTGLIDRFQTDAKESRKEFLDESKAARVDFLTGLRDLEARRDLADERLHATLTNLQLSMASMHEVMRERGVPAPDRKD